jgi:hypothetical protein
MRLHDAGTPAAPHPLLTYELPFPFPSISKGRELADAVRAHSRYVYTERMMPSGST